jgi:hypothetical protein
MNPRRRCACLGLQSLEGREVPANLTVTFNPATHTLTVVGDASSNDVTVQGDAADPTHLLLQSTGSINNLGGSYSSPTGVRNLVIKMLGGNDSVVVSNVVPVQMAGSLTIDGGDGANFVNAADLTVGKNLSVTNGRNDVLTDTTTLDNLTTGGNVTIKNGAGDTQTSIIQAVTGSSRIGGTLTITNGAGTDAVAINDTNVRGNVTVNNGAGGPAGAGYVDIYNVYNAIRSVFGGNLSVAYQSGDTTFHDGLWDLEVVGNATLNHGPGRFITDVDGSATAQPVVVRGNFSLLGTGPNTLNVSVPGVGQVTGLVVGKKFTVATGAGLDALVLNKLQVGGDTRLMLGDGDNTVTIDDSVFAGRFALTTGAGIDTVNLETTAGTAGPTEFEKAAVVALGGGNDDGFFATYNGGTFDAHQVVVILGTFLLSGLETSASTNQVIFPFGGQFN